MSPPAEHPPAEPAALTPAGPAGPAADLTPAGAADAAVGRVDASGVPPARLVLAAVVAAAALLLLLPGGLRVLEVREQLLVGVAVVTLLALAAMVLVPAMPGVDGGVRRWRIGPWFLLWTGVSYGLASITWLAPQTGIATRIALPSVVQALTIAAVAIVVWTVGYCIGPPRAVRQAAGKGLAVLVRGTSAAIRGGAMPWLVYGIGTAARLAGVALSGRLGYVGDPRGLLTAAAAYANILHIVSAFTLFAIAAAAYRAFGSRTRGRVLTLLTLLALEAAAGALAGGKQYFILAVLAVLIPYTAARGRLSVGILATATVLFLWLVVPFNVAYREYVRSPQANLPVATAVAGAPEIAAGVVGEQSPTATVAASSEQMLYRLRQSDSLAIVVQRTPAVIPYRSPLEYTYAPFIGLIPRAVWPDKPVLATGYEFNQEYYEVSRSLYSSTGVTPLGDLYRHGGWATVVVGMLLLGAGCRIFDQLLHAERDPRAVFFLLVLLPVIGRTGTYDLLVSLPTAVLTAVLGARLICRSAPPRPGRGRSGPPTGPPQPRLGAEPEPAR
jgi:hypothetical protein